MTAPQFSSGGPVVIDQEGVVLPPPPEPATVTLPCDQGCGETFTGPPSGPGSAPMQVGRHRYSVHGVKGAGKRSAGRKAAPAPTPVETGPRALVEGIHEAAAVVKGTGVPKADQLGGALGRGLSIVTVMAAGWAVDSDPAIQAAVANPDTTAQAAEHKAALVQLLSLSEQSAVKITAPLGRLLAPTSLNKKYGRALVDNSDLGPAVMEGVELVRGWAQFLALRRAHVAELRALRQQAAATAAGVPFPTAPPAAGPVPAPADDTGAGFAGVVATPTYRTQ